MVNPADMTDEELQTVIDTGVEPEEPESPEPEESEVEETPEEPEEEEKEQEEPKGEEEEEKSEEPQPSRREQLRIQQLLKKYGPPPERPAAPSQTAKAKALDYKEALDADPEVIEQLEADRQAYSDAAYQQGIQQSITREWKRDLKYDAPSVEKDFPFLNPKDTQNFKPAAADAMNQKYLRFVGYNPGDPEKGIPESVQHADISYREFVESEMEFVDELASQKIAESTKKIVKQSATTGLRPDGSSAKRLNLNKSEKDMTMEELYAAIGQKPPK